MTIKKKPDFLERLYEEREEVLARYTKLVIFMDSPRFFEEINTAQQTLMKKQQHHMRQYVLILGERIGHVELEINTA